MSWCLKNNNKKDAIKLIYWHLKILVFLQKKQKYFTLMQLLGFFPRLPNPFCYSWVNFHHGCQQNVGIRKPQHTHHLEKAPEVKLQTHSACATRHCILFSCPGCGFLSTLMCCGWLWTSLVTLDLSEAPGAPGWPLLPAPAHPGHSEVVPGWGGHWGHCILAHQPTDS